MATLQIAAIIDHDRSRLMVVNIDDASAQRIIDVMSSTHGLVMPGEVTGMIADAIKWIIVAKVVSNTNIKEAMEDADIPNPEPEVVQPSPPAVPPANVGERAGPVDNGLGDAGNTASTPPTPSTGEQVEAKKGKRKG